MSIKSQALSGTKWTTLSTLLTIALQLIQVYVLTKLLSKHDFGLMAIATIIIGFSQVFIDMGVSNLLIYKQKLSIEQLSSLYWINIISSFIVFLIIIFIAPLVASFYNEVEVKLILYYLSVVFIIQSFGQQFKMLLQKELCFKTLANIEIFTKFINFVLSIAFAFLDYGVYSLVYAILITTCISTMLLIKFGLKINKPKFYFKFYEIKEFISFGAYQTGDSVINYFNSQADSLLIGKLLGTEALGIYNIAKQVIQRPFQAINPIITRVSLPIMAKVQTEKQRLKDIYIKTINYLCSLNFPIYFVIFLFSSEITIFIFGEKWVDAVPIVKILALWGAFYSIGNPVGSLLVSRGKVKWSFIWNVILSLYILFSIYLGSFWGLEGVSWSLLFVSLSLIIPNWRFLVKPLCGADFLEYHISILIPFFISSTAFVIGFILLDIIGLYYIKYFTPIILLLILNYYFNNDFFTLILEALGIINKFKITE